MGGADRGDREGLLRVAAPYPVYAIINAEDTSKGTVGLRRLISFLPRFSNATDGGIGAKPDGGGTAPGVVCGAGSATGSGAVSGVAKPSGRSSGA